MAVEFEEIISKEEKEYLSDNEKSLIALTIFRDGVMEVVFIGAIFHRIN